MGNSNNISDSEPNHIAVLGAGSWGTALALALARNTHHITLWGHRPQHCESMLTDGLNRQYLDNFKFPKNLNIENDLAAVVATHRLFLLVVPSHAFRATLKKMRSLGIAEDATIIWATKGFDNQGPCLLSQAVVEELGQNIGKAIVSGPSFSKEVAANLPTAITASADTPELAQAVSLLFHGDRMRLYTNPDFVGVQVGGAIKNVIAIAAGISDGLGFGANSRTAIITRGLAEISRLGVALGAEKETFQGLAGMGDLVLTCTDNQSRNRRLGLSLGQGKTIDATLQEIGQEVEGYTSAPEVLNLAKQENIEMPICEQVYKVLYHNVPALDAVSSLLTREPIVE